MLQRAACTKAVGIDVVGTLGVVLRAKKKALIPSAADVLKALCLAGLRLEDEMVRSVLGGVGETWE